MEKIYKLEGLDCANCAAKMERKVGKIKGIDQVTVDFMSTKMLLETAELTSALVEKIEAAVHKVDRNVVLQGI